MKIILRLVVAAGALAVVGCGSGGATSSKALTPATIATPAAMATPAPTPDLKANAAKQYLAIANANNAASDALNKKYPATFTSVAQAHEYWKAASDLDLQWIKNLDGITFPAEMAADVLTP